ncbi:hypothetical protein FK178_05595 [Antarcticibacterium arcticum]|uniref:TerB family tellurite resistance protein n=1 Tax=Antarcticibacterium arcticum TaxID=2585771 RepID=A0A5B8YH56_9FLAO|nr:hypothetical protein [Antarcticibacterium arcticum]QED37215.1 hypothetical protein FK178_05595 [Antarcticibacterium arcticum]
MYTLEDLYSQLGKLFYAIAASDKRVRDEERNTLRIILENEWKNDLVNAGEWGYNAADQIEMTFDWMDLNQPSAYAVFKEFKDFKNDNEELFTPEIKQMIWKTADGIASTFAGKNKSELVMLSKLKSIL